MRESEIEKEVCEYAAREYDVIPYKFTSPSRRNVPDRLLVGTGGRYLFIEFKATGKHPSEGQKREMVRLIARNHPVQVVDNICQGKRIVDMHFRNSI